MTSQSMRARTSGARLSHARYHVEDPPGQLKPLFLSQTEPYYKEITLELRQIKVCRKVIVRPQIYARVIHQNTLLHPIN